MLKSSLRLLRRQLGSPHSLNPLLPRFYSAATSDHTHDIASSSDEGTDVTAPSRPSWWEDYREKVHRVIFQESPRRQSDDDDEEEEEEEAEERSGKLNRALLDAALRQPDEAEEKEVHQVSLEEQRSLIVGIIGAPNAGKSSLMNCMVGSKVTAVSRKTNTTTQEMLGVLTQGSTQICIFDTPGVTLNVWGHPRKTDVRARVNSAWKHIEQYDLLVVIFDVHRHLTMRRDKRVLRLINHLGSEAHPTQRRVLCMNKVDLIHDKDDLLKASEEFKDLPGYDRCFAVSGLKGTGVKSLIQYLKEQAIKRPWDEDPAIMSDMPEEMMKAIALEVVREKMLNHVHQEIPYTLEHRLMGWKELRDGSLRIEQHFIVSKQSQRQIIVGKNGSKIGRIGVEANEELRSTFKRDVHLFLYVRVARKHGA